jgi:hypothetical protein
MRKGAKEAAVENGTVTGTAPERDMVIEIVRGTRTDVVKETEKEDIAMTDLVLAGTVDIATGNATVIGRASVTERIEIETGIADEEEMIWMTRARWKIAQRGEGQTIPLMR